MREKERSGQDGKHCLEKNSQFWELGKSMDKIGLRRFMEGMVSERVLREYVETEGCALALSLDEQLGQRLGY